ARDEPAGHLGSLGSRELTDHPIGAVVPWQARRARQQLVLARQVEKRRQHDPGRRLAGSDELWNRIVDDVSRGPLPPIRLHRGDREVGRPQHDPDEKAASAHPKASKTIPPPPTKLTSSPGTTTTLRLVFPASAAAILVSSRAAVSMSSRPESAG